MEKTLPSNVFVATGELSLSTGVTTLQQLYNSEQLLNVEIDVLGRKDMSELVKQRASLWRERASLTKELLIRLGREEPLNQYERFVAHIAVKDIWSNMFIPYQHPAQRLLEARAQHHELHEEEEIENELKLRDKEYARQTAVYPEEYPDNRLSRLLYGLELAAYQVYGTAGLMDSLIRRLIKLRKPQILALCDKGVPTNNTINRAYIYELFNLLENGEYPEWLGGRFTHKLSKHILDPYTDKAFQGEKTRRTEQIDRVVEIVFNKIPGVLAVGKTGSLARESNYGFHPTQSDMDLIVYTYGDTITINAVHELLDKLGKEYGVEIGMGPGLTMPTGMGMSPLVFATPDQIYQHQHISSNNGLFTTYAMFAANHIYGTIMFNRMKSHEFELLIDKPLKTFYATQITPLKKRIVEEMNLEER